MQSKRPQFTISETIANETVTTRFIHYEAAAAYAQKRQRTHAKLTSRISYLGEKLAKALQEVHDEAV